MPRVILMTEQHVCPNCKQTVEAEEGKCTVCGETTQIVEAAFCECEYIPSDIGDKTEVEVAEETSKLYCSKCGFKRDAGERGMQILCFHPASPYLEQIKAQALPQKR